MNFDVPNSNFHSRMQVQSRDQLAATKVSNSYTMERQRRYRTYEARLLSFVDWPGQYVPKTPEELAAAGFFYIGSADRVTCFQCGITLRDWEAEHDPVTEHQRHAQECPFIKHHIATLTEVPSTTRPEASYKSHSEECPEASLECHPATPPEASLEATAVPTATERPHCSAGRIEQDFDKLVIAGIADVASNTVGNPHSSRAVESGPKSIEVMVSTPSSCADASDKMDACPRGASDGRDPTEKRTGKDIHFKMTSNGNSKRVSNLVAENRRLREQSVCMICKTEKACVLYLPCGHLVTCPHCAVNTQHCVRCSKDILGTVRTYMT